MRLYSNTLTDLDVRAAFTTARVLDGQDIFIADPHTFRPRTYAHGVEFYAHSVHGNRATAHRPIGSYDLYDQPITPRDAPRAASWTAYGYVLARLFTQDPDAKIGTYDGVGGFAEQVCRYVPRGESIGFLSLLPGHGGALTCTACRSDVWRDGRGTLVDGTGGNVCIGRDGDDLPHTPRPC